MSNFFSPACSRAFNDAAHSHSWSGNPKLYLLGFLKMLVLAIHQIYTRVFHLYKSIDLDSAWVKDSRPCQFTFPSCVLARLAMQHTRVFGIGIPNSPYRAF